MSYRRPALLIGSLIAVAGACFGLAAGLDEQKGWNHPGQAVANVAWIAMWLAVLGIVVCTGLLVVRAGRRRAA